MDTICNVKEYKCPCCNAALIFGAGTQKMTCEYCDNTFDLSTVVACDESESIHSGTELHWDNVEPTRWSPQEESIMKSFVCESCGGELITDDHTAATFCPYCGNATILPSRVSDSLKPEGIIPFKTTKKDAQKAFLELCKGKPLLPQFFTEQHQIEKITGIYVPFWLYECSADLAGSYKATRIHSWSDANYIYTKTDHYLLQREADADFSGIPLDGSSKMEDSFMESLEPYHYDDIVEFDMAYLSGFLADKYDVDAKSGEDRIRQRVENTMNDQMQSTFIGYTSVLPANRQIQINHGRTKYVLLPVWLLNTKYQGKIYTFAMNGQTGKMTGSLPVCPKRSAAWFFGLWAGITALTAAILMIL